MCTLNKNKSEMLLFLFLFVATINGDCSTDSNCKNCSVLVIPAGIFIVTQNYCFSCKANFTADASTNICQCSKGYYPADATTCAPCPITCATCTDASTCTACYTGDNRQLASGKCSCMDGYQQRNNQIICRQKPNILMIVLSTIGSAICMVLGFVLCAFIRMRRGSQQIHAQSRKRRTSRNAEIEVYYEEYESNNMENNNSNLFWNAKAYEYKSDQICSICLDVNPLFMTQCGHYFHSKCIYSWLSNKTACPNCNKQMDAKQVRRWCERCRKVLMPVVMNVMIKRMSKKRKQLVQSNPIQNQLCDNCENQSIQISHLNQKQRHSQTNDQQIIPQNSQV